MLNPLVTANRKQFKKGNQEFEIRRSSSAQSVASTVIVKK